MTEHDFGFYYCDPSIPYNNPYRPLDFSGDERAYQDPWQGDAGESAGE